MALLGSVTMPEQTTDGRPSQFVRIEALALDELANRLDGPMRENFERAAEFLLAAIADGRHVIVTGVGKSGLIAQKIAATLRSTGTPAHYLHPTEAVHGDLGMLSRGDAVIALSASGETEELLRLIPLIKRFADRLIALCGNASSTLALASDAFLDTGVSEEACPHNLAPTASTTVMLALGDTLALEISRRRGWQAEDFAKLHPGGRLGKRMARVADLMHGGPDMPKVAGWTPMPEVIYEMSRKKLGMTTVIDDNGMLLGMISDGDLRRLLERDGGKALDHTAGEIMNSKPITIESLAFASAALALMEEKKITSLIVLSETGKAEGVLHLHDLWTLELI